MGRVELQNVDKVYPDGHKAITDFNLAVEDGEFVILVGPSGCGKSTALRMIAGLEDITAGKLFIGDRVVNHLSPKERDIAMVFQSYALYPHMSVADNMGFALKLAKIDSSEIEKRVRDAAEILGLTEHLDRKPRALSGGQRQRVAMGRAIVRSPEAFLMDEPLSNLDAKLRVQMRAEIAGIQERLGTTTVYVTHDQVEAMTMGDRVAVLKQGYLMQVDTPQALYDNPDNLFVAGFMGSPAMNLAEATVRKADGKVYLEVPNENSEIKRLRVADAALDRYPAAAEDGRRVVIGMRPEHFVPASQIDDPEMVWEDRRVNLVELLGAEMLVHFDTPLPPIVSDDMKAAMDDEEAFEALQEQARTGGQPFTARFQPGSPPKVGDHIDIGFRTEYLHFFDLENGHALR